MKPLPFRLVCLLIVAFSVFAATTHAAQASHQFERIFYMSKLHLVDGLQSLQKNAASIDVVAPQFYTINAALMATGSVPVEIQTLAAANGIKVMPLIANVGFNQNVIHRFLLSSAAQAGAISFLIQEAEAHHYVGWQFDFEHMAAGEGRL